MINEFVYMLRTERNISIQELCEGICNPSTLNRFENGQTSIKHDTLFKILERLQVTNLNFNTFKMTPSEYEKYSKIRKLVYYRDFENLQIKLNSLNHKTFKPYFTKYLDYVNVLLSNNSESYSIARENLDALSERYQSTLVADLIDISILASLSKAYIYENNLEQAKFYLDKCTHSKLLSDPINHQFLIDISLLNAKIDKREGNVEKAIHHLLFAESLLLKNTSIYRLNEVYTMVINLCDRCGKFDKSSFYQNKLSCLSTLFQQNSSTELIQI